MFVRRLTLFRVLLALAMIALVPSVFAQADCEPQVGRFVSVTGNVSVQRTGSPRWVDADLSTRLCEGDTIRVSDRSRAALALINDAVLRLDQNTTMRLLDVTDQEEESSLLDVFRGAFQSFSRKPKFLKVNTPYLNGSIEGTEFLVRVDENATAMTVFEGVVLAANEGGEVAVGPGESAQAAKGQAPERRTVVRPRDQVQWALYYPPILSAPAAAGASPALTKAANCAANGNTACAFAALDEVPARERDAPFYLQRASVLLSVGRVEEARADIDVMLQRDPNAGLGYALRSVIAVTQNENAAALADAQRAVELSPESSAARIALSYALQADFRIEAARDNMRAAVEQQPNDALAWARLAELELMLGNRSRALESAQKARTMAPGLSRTELVFGFSALAVFRNDEAKAAFARAIALDSADPLAHLGLGLAKISDGELAAGRKDLEAAVALDSSSALLRAYLGKAYFDERRYPLDKQQFDIAKDLDPNDPTAFLYSGILNQTINRPVEAVRDIEQSIELNDNRAVFRSRLLLDQDRAARGTSLARAYNDLGFKELGLDEATKSLAVDPGNASAHRFLSDTYQDTRRTEISRVSELLQAQLLQDVNINPVQPSISATNLNIVTLGGPASAGFNEFTPLYQRNKTQFNLSGFGGNKDTYGGEAVVSGTHQQLSYSVGGFSSRTDGWRPNNQLDQEVYNLFVQGAVSPALNLQAEFQRRQSEEGDLRFNFDPDSFSPNASISRDRDVARIGLRFSPAASERHTFLANVSYIDADDASQDSEQLSPFETFDFEGRFKEEGTQAEAQYIYQRDRTDLIVGAARADIDRDNELTFTISDVDLGPLFSFQDAFTEEVEQSRGYAYLNGRIASDSVDWTVGLSYDDYQEGILQEDSWNPKLGLRWHANETLTLRAAAFKVLKPALVNNRTIEPTQVAGFNQFFDDVNGTRSWRYAGGLTWRARQELTVGAEATWRDLDEPVSVFDEATGTQEIVTEDRDEQFHKLFAYWTPNERLGVSAEVVYDEFKSQPGVATQGGVPEKVETFSVPVGANYFHPSGFFAGVVGTYVDQEVRRSEESTLGQGTDDFFVFDAAVGYRLAKRRGILSLQVKNLFDQEFNYQDDSYREFSPEPATGPYFPTRLIVGRITLSF